MQKEIKFLIINGSPRKDGNTHVINEIIKKSLMKMGKINGENIEFLEINLRNIDIPMCRGCNTCFLTGEYNCPHNSIISDIVERIKLCDCLIVSTPVYSMQVSALLKNFIDHMSYNDHRPIYSKKKSIVVSTSKKGDGRKVSLYMKKILKKWGFNDVYTLPVKCKSFRYTPVEKDIKNIEKISQKVYKDIKYKRNTKILYKEILSIKQKNKVIKNNNIKENKNYKSGIKLSR